MEMFQKECSSCLGPSDDGVRVAAKAVTWTFDLQCRAGPLTAPFSG